MDCDRGRRPAGGRTQNEKAAREGIFGMIGSATTAILALPRSVKRLIMVIADAIAIPTALWAALALKFDRLDPHLDRTFAYFIVAAVSALLVFALLGLYRAVV